MLKQFIAYFSDRHLLSNLIFLFVLVGGLVSWQAVPKEEMPDVTFDFVRISAVYPGATAEEVEHFVTREIEDAIKGVDGVYRYTSTASQGSTTVSVEIEQDYPNKPEVITEIRNAVLDADFPDDMRDDPDVRVFKTSKKAIIDIAFIHRDYHLLDVSGRRVLQEYAYSLENQLLNLPQVNSITKTGYLQEEIQIDVDPAKLTEYIIPLSQVISEVKDNHVRQPSGHLEAINEPKVTVNAQLDQPQKLEELFVQAGFKGDAIALKQVATVNRAYKRDKEILKVNGHEAVMFNVVKNTSYGILDTLKAVNKVVEQFNTHYLKEAPVQLVVLDDESIDLRNRLGIIASNGCIGFVLILVTLFLFLNRESGFWVAMGIPFTACFTLICGHLLGYTINNTTLAAVIIVMGIVVDDAIVIAENISRKRQKGLSRRDASVEGTSEMVLPIVASIVTTCAAFVPLLFFEGRFGQLNAFIPPVIFLMLGASLLESVFVLPGHMHLFLPKIKRSSVSDLESSKKHWFDAVEDAYGQFLKKLLQYKLWVFLGLFVLLFGSLWIMTKSMKFVMFPNEETRDIVISGYLEDHADRYATAQVSRDVEQIFDPYLGQEVVGYRTEIARSRRGGAVEENRFRTIVEIVPKEQRDVTADALIARWTPLIEQVPGMKKVVFQKSRWGQSSGSAIEVVVQQDDDDLRREAAYRLAQKMKENPDLTAVEIEKPIDIPEYKIDLKREKIKRLSIRAQDIASTLRASLEGSVLYEIPYRGEEIDVRLSIKDTYKTNIDDILNIPVENKNNYLVPLRDVVDVTQKNTPNAISRTQGKRTVTVYADLKKGSKKTPLDIAADLEENVFGLIIQDQPSTVFSFEGEVYDSRQSKGDFKRAIVFVMAIIFVILAVLFNSLLQPLIILLTIPFGVVGVVLAFLLHGKMVYGFFASIGMLGMAGVVINDSIVMIDKFNREFFAMQGSLIDRVADIAQTRLKAVFLTTLTTVVGVMPTAYGIAGFDAMLSEMMLALSWGLLFGMVVTLILVPAIYCLIQELVLRRKGEVLL